MRVTLAVIAGLLISFASVQEAGASATGCTNDACVAVRGSGTWVSQVRGGVFVGYRQTVTGFSHITSSDGRLSITTPTNTYTDNEPPSKLGPNPPGAAYWSDWNTVNNSFPNGTRVCSTFWKKNPKGDFSADGTACETIHT